MARQGVTIRTGDSRPIRVSGRSHQTLSTLSEQLHQPITTIMDEAVEAYRRKIVMERTNAAYAALKADAKAWKAYQQEAREWDGTLLDGLTD